MVTGGEFKAPTLSLTGQKAADFFEMIHVDKLFLATAGISVKNGLTYPGISDICVKQAMINSANVTYLLADSSKLGQNSFVSLGNISLIDILITDSGISQEDEDNLLQNDINVIKASI
jgi:DeoR/GlpR family transcriptional regulator of sugar metabolism